MQIIREDTYLSNLEQILGIKGDRLLLKIIDI